MRGDGGVSVSLFASNELLLSVNIIHKGLINKNEPVRRI